MNVTYRTDKIKRHIDHKIKKLPTDKLLLPATQVRLAISNSTNNNFTAPDGINIRHLKHLGLLTCHCLLALDTAQACTKLLSILTQYHILENVSQ